MKNTVFVVTLGWSNEILGVFSSKDNLDLFLKEFKESDQEGIPSYVEIVLDSFDN